MGQVQESGVRAVVRRVLPLPTVYAGMGAYVLVVAVPHWVGMVTR